MRIKEHEKSNDFNNNDFSYNGNIQGGNSAGLGNGQRRHGTGMHDGHASGYKYNL